MSPTHIETPGGPHPWQKLLYFLIIFILISTLAISSSSNTAAFAQQQSLPDNPSFQGMEPADPIVDEQIEQSWHPAYLKLATGDPTLRTDHGVYPWPFGLDSIGWSMQSYQDYGGTPYFHHGMDMMKIFGTQVYNQSGGQVINIENYQPGWNLYWEIAILDSYGYIWQYHHVDEPTIPQYIWDKYDEYLADPINGGFIPADTHIGNIVEWPVWSFGKQFNHIHLNILAAGGVYVNGFEFHYPLMDTVGPQIQALGLLQNGQILPGNMVDGSYSIYVRAHDLILDTVYYLPPWEITFSVDGGPVQTTWRFDTLPGGADDTAYLSDFYIVPPTCGDYDCREYYIDVGFIPDSQYVFPSTGGEHTVQVMVRDYAGNTASQVFTYTVIGPPAGEVVWQDDFETNLGWQTNPDGTDTATSGLWERADPQQTYSGGPKQLGTTPSGYYDLVTGHLAGSTATSYDVDGGITSICSPEIILPAGENLVFSFRNYLAHGTNASSADFLRIQAIGSTTSTIFEELGAPNNDDGVWSLNNASLDAFAGQTIRLLIIAADNGSESLVEAAIDDVFVVDTGPNLIPVADSQEVTTDEDVAINILLTGMDPEGDPLSYNILSNPQNGILSGVAPNLTYSPAVNFNGADNFTFAVNDGYQNSAQATVNITVASINDPPIAEPQSVITRQNLPVAITLTGSDVDSPELTYSYTLPAHGTLSGVAPDLIYTPWLNFAGLDSFTFIVNDGELDSLPAEININIYHTIYIPLIQK